MKKLLFWSLILFNSFSSFFYIQAMEHIVNQNYEPLLYLKNDTTYSFNIKHTNVAGKDEIKTIKPNQTLKINKLNNIKKIDISYEKFTASLLEEINKQKAIRTRYQDRDLYLTIGTLGSYGWSGWTFNPKISETAWIKTEPEMEKILAKPGEEPKVTIKKPIEIDEDLMEKRQQAIEYLKQLENQQPREILGLPAGPLSSNDINSAYRKLALKWHPDKNRKIAELANEITKKVNAAKETILELIRLKKPY